MQVMLIEDDPLVRVTLAELLAEEGIEVDGVASAEDALILLGAGQVPDVLVSDIDLGAGLSGIALAGIARERHPDVELLLISGQPLERFRSPLRRHEHFLQKPFTPQALAEAIRRLAREAEADPAR